MCRDFGKLIGIAVAINERRDLFLDRFCGDMKQIGPNRNAIHLFIFRIDSIDLDFYPSGLRQLLASADAEARFR